MVVVVVFVVIHRCFIVIQGAASMTRSVTCFIFRQSRGASDRFLALKDFVVVVSLVRLVRPVWKDVERTKSIRRRNT